MAAPYTMSIDWAAPERDEIAKGAKTWKQISGLVSEGLSQRIMIAQERRHSQT
jgi:hypothetical protein